MNTKSKVLVGLMAICLLGGVGSTLALTRSGASVTGNPGAFDKAIYLYWGHEESSVELPNVENLQPSQPQYVGLTVSPKSSKSVAGNVKLDFTLAASEGEHHIKGLTVSVYKIDAELNQATAAAQIEGKEAAPVLDEDHLTGNTTFAVAAGEAVHETVAYYAIAVNWSGAQDLEHSTYSLDASITISQQFVA